MKIDLFKLLGILYWKAVNFWISDCGDWKPPTEAEMKILEARRQRQDQISRLMGEYLLKGCTMLSTTCSCGVCMKYLLSRVRCAILFYS